MPTKREIARKLRAKGKLYREIGAALGVTSQRAQQLCTTEPTGRPVGRPKVNPPAPPRTCRCGCGEIIALRYKQYLPGHQELAWASAGKGPRICRCGCGNVIALKSKQYLPGHQSALRAPRK